MQSAAWSGIVVSTSTASPRSLALQWPALYLLGHKDDAYRQVADRPASSRPTSSNSTAPACPDAATSRALLYRYRSGTGVESSDRTATIQWSGGISVLVAGESEQSKAANRFNP